MILSNEDKTNDHFDWDNLLTKICEKQQSGKKYAFRMIPNIIANGATRCSFNQCPGHPELGIIKQRNEGDPYVLFDE